jgi:hypothetical protein
VSWDAYLVAEVDGNPVTVGEWNYTHNCNRMANHVVQTTMPLLDDLTWWKHLDGMDGATGLAFLDVIVGGLMEAPTFFRCMNPTNGWGDFDSFLGVLIEMRDTAERYPSAKWSVSG